MTADRTNDPELMLASALLLASIGLRVHPIHVPLFYTVDRDGKVRCDCRRVECWIHAAGGGGGKEYKSVGKHPRLMQWGTKATTDPERIKEWFGRMFPGSNIGIVCGTLPSETEGLVVLDVDPRNEGDDTIKELERKLGALPETVQAISGSGGPHYYLRTTTAMGSSKLPPGIDVQAGRGAKFNQVVAPPSIHWNGRRYSWEVSGDPTDGVTIAPLPEAWRAHILESSKRDSKVSGTGPDADSPILDGDGGKSGQGRKATLIRRGRSMWAAEFSREEIRAAIETMNGRCVPPLDENDLRRVLEFITSVPPGRSKEFEEKIRNKTEKASAPAPSGDPLEERKRKAQAAIELLQKAMVDPSIAHSKDVHFAAARLRRECRRVDDKLAKEYEAVLVRMHESLPEEEQDAWERDVANALCYRPDDKRARIEITPDEHDVAEKTQHAVVDCAAKLGLYEREFRLVRVIRTDTATQSDEIRRRTGSPQIVAVEKEHFRTIASECAFFFSMKRDEETGQMFIVQCPPHMPAVGSVYARKHWPGMPVLQGLTTVPIPRPDGSLHTTPGYDQETGMFYVPTGPTPDVPQNPTQDDARKALQTIEWIFSDFPFEASHHKAAVVAALLTLIARPLFEGSSPLFLIEASSMSSGKGLIAEAIGLIVAGEFPTMMAWPDNEEEARKRITAAMLGGDPFVVIDNATTKIGGGALEMLLTTKGSYSDRTLGKSENIKLPNRITWCVTANNPNLSRDMTRRVVDIRLVPDQENPEDRTPDSFKIPDLVGYVREHRSELLAALFTILRAFILAGKPAQPCKPWGSNPSWERMVVHPLIWAGGADPGLGREEAKQYADTETECLPDLLQGWMELQEGLGAQATGVTVSDAVRVLERNDSESSGPHPSDRRRYERLRNALDSLSPGTGRPNYRKLGYVLRRFRDRKIAGMTLKAKTGHNNVKSWTVITVAGGDAVRGGDHGGDVLTMPPTTSSAENQATDGFGGDGGDDVNLYMGEHTHARDPYPTHPGSSYDADRAHERAGGSSVGSSPSPPSPSTGNSGWSNPEDCPELGPDEAEEVF